MNTENLSYTYPPAESDSLMLKAERLGRAARKNRLSLASSVVLLDESDSPLKNILPLNKPFDDSRDMMTTAREMNAAALGEPALTPSMTAPDNVLVELRHGRLQEIS